MMGIPFTVLFLALAYNLVAGHRRPDREPSGCLAVVLSVAMLPFTLGAIGAINTWDLPTYLGVGIVAWGIREWLGFGRLRIVPTLVYVVGLAGLAYGLYLPFYRNYTTVFETGVGLTYIKTQLGPWLRIWGFFLFVAVSYLVMEWRRPGNVPVLRWLAGLIRHADRAPRFLDLVAAWTRPAWTLPFGQAVLALARSAGWSWPFWATR